MLLLVVSGGELFAAGGHDGAADGGPGTEDTEAALALPSDCGDGLVAAGGFDGASCGLGAGDLDTTAALLAEVGDGLCTSVGFAGSPNGVDDGGTAGELPGFSVSLVAIVSLSLALLGMSAAAPCTLR